MTFFLYTLVLKYTIPKKSIDLTVNFLVNFKNLHFEHYSLNYFYKVIDFFNLFI